jgi:hypothetical protein
MDTETGTEQELFVIPIEDDNLSSFSSCSTVVCNTQKERYCDLSIGNLLLVMLLLLTLGFVLVVVLLVFILTVKK